MNIEGTLKLKTAVSLVMLFILFLVPGARSRDDSAVFEKQIGEFIPPDDGRGSDSGLRGPIYECPDYTVFGQPRHLPQDDWQGLTSDIYSSMNYLVYDNFADAGLIRGVHFWGLNAYYDDMWEICYKSPITFKVMFYADDNNFPRDTLATYRVSSEATPAGAFFNGGYQLYEYYVELNPPVELNEGWISIQAISYPTDCWFIWMSGTDGLDEYCYQMNQYLCLGFHYDRAFCLIGPEAPTKCTDMALFSQAPDLPGDVWQTWAINGDIPRSDDITVYDNFENGLTANQISFWGLCGHDAESRTWEPCQQAPLNFEINFLNDDNGLPGNPEATYICSPEGSPTGIIYNETFELYRFTTFFNPAPQLIDGWISISGTDGTDCQFLWLSSAQGINQTSYQWGGAGYQEMDYDLSFCLDHISYTCGDVNDDGYINITDIVYIINFKYKGGPSPEPLVSSDVNNDGDINILDIVYLINFKYKGGPDLNCP